MERNAMALLIVATMVVGLWLDAQGFPGCQEIVSLWVWTIFFMLFLQRRNLYQRSELLLCLGIATLGEVVLSICWGLYDYRAGNLPLFVPPGHVLLYLLGKDLAQRMPDWIVTAVPLLFAPYILYGLVSGRDVQSGIWYLLLLVVLKIGDNCRLYALMFLLAFTLEIYGTGMANWAWRPTVPGLGISSANPPASVGAFYAVLDLLVIGTERWVGSFFRDYRGCQKL
jgi:hypothetical protein